MADIITCLEHRCKLLNYHSQGHCISHLLANGSQRLDKKKNIKWQFIWTKISFSINVSTTTIIMFYQYASPCSFPSTPGGEGEGRAVAPLPIVLMQKVFNRLSSSFLGRQPNFTCSQSTTSQTEQELSVSNRR